MNRRILLFSIIAILLFIICSCQRIPSDLGESGKAYTNLSVCKEYLIEENLIKLSQFSAEELVKEIKDLGHCRNALVQKGGSVLLELTEEDRMWWLEHEIQLLQGLNNSLYSENNSYTLSWNQSFTQIKLYCDRGLSDLDISKYVLASEFYAGLCQVFSSANSEWSVSIDMFNAQTGLIVASGSSEADLSYNNQSWADSYQEDWRKAYEKDSLFITYDQEYISYLGLSVDKLYRYLKTYNDHCRDVVPEAVSVTLVVDPDQIADLLELQKELIKQEEKSFSGLFPGYKVVFSEDCRSLELYYDRQISNSEIAAEAVECLLLASNTQFFNAGNSSDWAVNVKIYNKNTGELKLSEDIPQEKLSIVSQNGWD